MRVYLDDVRNPTEAFDLVIRTAPELIELVRTGLVTFISFDHDLGAVAHGTGYDVAKEIESLAASHAIPPRDYVIHSSNPVGARNINAAMTKAHQFWSDTTRRIDA